MSNHFWQEKNFRFEPWSSDYDSPIKLNEEISPSESEVDPTVETAEWQPYQPKRPPKLPSRLIFMDGRRRIDAALVGGEGNAVAYGAFGTIAVGAVVVDRIEQTATCANIIIKRVVGFGGNQQAPLTRIPCPLGSSAELIYEPVNPCAENTPQVRNSLVQNAMLQTEAQLATEQLTSDPETLVIRDGRLPYTSPSCTLGYVKTMHKTYLSAKHSALLWELKAGQRSPIFLIKEQNRPRWSWYLKSGDANLCPEQLGYHALQGIVRLELHCEVPLKRAKQIADQSTYLIPQYASHPSRDPRAPQNLTPIGGLERELGRRMGDKMVIERRLRSFLASIGERL